MDPDLNLNYRRVRGLPSRVKLDPDLNFQYRHAKDHSAELHRQAELHRLTTPTRPDRKAKPRPESTLRFPNPVSGISWIIRRATAAVNRAA
jgi:hypothetical protein